MGANFIYFWSILCWISVMLMIFRDDFSELLYDYLFMFKNLNIIGVIELIMMTTIILPFNISKTIKYLINQNKK